MHGVGEDPSTLAPRRAANGDPQHRHSRPRAALASLDPASEVIPEASEALTPYLVRVALLAGCSGLLFGWDTGVAAGVLVAIKGDLGHPLSAGEQEMVVSATTAGALLGSLIAGRLADWMGRKRVIVIAALLFLLGSLEQTASQDVPQLVLGRLIVGIAVGQAATVVPMYLAEVAPTSLRGRIVGMNSLLITGGQVVAYLVNAALFPLSHSWRWMVLASALPAVVQLCGLVTLDESPRWLVNKGRFVQARRVMKKIYPMATEEQVESMVDRIVDSLSSGNANTAQKGPRSASALSGQMREEGLNAYAGDQRSKWALLFKEPQNRRALILAAGLQAFQQASGFNAMLYYSSRLLLMAGFKTNPNVFATLVAIANFVGTIGAMRLVDTWGRRRLLLWTTAFMVVSLLVLAGCFGMVGYNGDVVDKDPQSLAPPKPSATSVFEHVPAAVRSPAALLVQHSSWRRAVEDGTNASNGTASTPTTPTPPSSPNVWAIFSLIAMIFFTLFYALGQGIIPWLVLSEVFTGQVRSLGSGLASCANWSVNLIWSSLYLSFVEAVHGPGKTFLLFAAISTGAWVFTYYWLPELKGVNINDVGRAFGGGDNNDGAAVVAANDGRFVVESSEDEGGVETGREHEDEDDDQLSRGPEGREAEERRGLLSS